MNTRPDTASAVLVGMFAAPFLVVGLALNWLFHGGWIGFVIVVVVTAALTWAAHRSADAVILWASGAHPADPDTHPRLFNLVEGLSITAGVPEPALYVIDDAAPNALTVGRNPQRAAIAVTTGLLDGLNRIELEAVLANLIGRIRNDDLYPGTIAVTTGGVAVLISDLAARNRDAARAGSEPVEPSLPAFAGWMSVPFAPLGVRMLDRVTDPDRERSADLSGVDITRYPPGLITALEKIRDDDTPTGHQLRATAHLWFRGPRSGSTDTDGTREAAPVGVGHGSLDQRIERLREL